MATPKCTECGAAVTDPAVILVRTTPKGQPANWKCERCAGKLAPPEAQAIDRALNDD